jgi:N-acetylmuramoyl-L-alanine amidase
MKIYIDPGHSGVWPKGDPGVVSQDGTKIESYYNWMYANALKNHLDKKGFLTELTREQDEYRIPFSQRTNKALPRDLLISLHFDTFQGGRKMIYYSQKTESLKLAEHIDKFFQSNFIRQTTTSRFGRLYIDDAKCPAVLVEVDRIDRATLDTGVVNSFCQEMENGIRSYLGQDIVTEENPGEIDGDNNIRTPFTRVFMVTPDNQSKEIPIERMSIVSDKLYFAPKKEWFEEN